MLLPILAVLFLGFMLSSFFFYLSIFLYLFVGRLFLPFLFTAFTGFFSLPFSFSFYFVLEFCFSSGPCLVLPFISFLCSPFASFSSFPLYILTFLNSLFSETLVILSFVYIINILSYLTPFVSFIPIQFTSSRLKLRVVSPSPIPRIFQLQRII